MIQFVRMDILMFACSQQKTFVVLLSNKVCTLVKHCLKKETGHPIFDDCFTVLNHRKRTRNNNLILKLSTIKLETFKQSFYFDAAIIFNQLLGKRMFKIDFNVLILNLIIILAVRFHAYPEFRILINSLS